MDSALSSGCSSVCLDLSVGLPAIRKLSPARDIEADPASCRAASVTKEQAKILEAELNKVNKENKRLTEMIASLYASQIAQHTPPSSPPSFRATAAPPPAKKRSMESIETINSCDANHKKSNTVHDEQFDSHSSDGSCKKMLAKRVCIRIDPSDSTLVVKDGYQWRKYGQKVTRDNPSPRAYFRCAFAPSCPVKKKVQRSAEDSSLLVATYEGEHNHPHPSQAEVSNCSTQNGSLPCSISINSTGPTITLDLTKQGLQLAEPDLKKVCREIVSPEFQRVLVEQMANSLTSDPKFTNALATAISGRILRQLPEQY